MPAQTQTTGGLSRPDHPQTAEGLNNLGVCNANVGDWKGALRCYERSLEIYRKAYGGSHPQIATTREVPSGR